MPIVGIKASHEIFLLKAFAAIDLIGTACNMVQAYGGCFIYRPQRECKTLSYQQNNASIFKVGYRHGQYLVLPIFLGAIKPRDCLWGQR